jgi:hypothetical protein
MKLLFIILLILLFIVYIKYYTKVNLDTEIIQVNLNNINYNILTERNPIVIYDKLVNTNDMINKTFKHLYSIKHQNLIFNDNIKQTLAKYAIFHNDTENDIEIFISNPIHSKMLSILNNTKNKDRQGGLSPRASGASVRNKDFITFKETSLENINSIKVILHPFNTLILPYNYIFKCETPCSNYFLFDLTNILIANWRTKFN